MNRFKLKGVDHLLWSKPAIVILSIVIAVFVWLFMVDPVETLTFAIPVETNALSDQYTIENKDLILLDTNVIPQKVDITLKGRRSFLHKLKKENFAAMIDFSVINSEADKSINITGAYQNGTFYNGTLVGVRIVDVSTKSVPLQVDKLGDNAVQVVVEQTGSEKAGYEVIEIRANPNIIQLQGGDSIVKRAQRAVVTVNVTNISSSYQDNVTVKILDSSGKEIKGTEKQYTTKINVKVARLVEVFPRLVGEPPAGYTKGDPTVVPSVVKISGSNKLLDKSSIIYTKDININSLTRDTVVNTELIIPEGITLEEQSKFVKVTIPVKGLVTKRFTLSKNELELVNKSNLYNYTILTPEISFSVKGSDHSLDNLTLTGIARVDVDKLGPGEHKLKYEVILPKDCTLVGKNEVKIRVDSIVP